MIAHYPEQFGNELGELGVSKMISLEPEVLMTIQVHDSLVLQGPGEVMMKQAKNSAYIMTQPWAELDNFSLGVEVKIGGPGVSWGELKVVEI